MSDSADFEIDVLEGKKTNKYIVNFFSTINIVKKEQQGYFCLYFSTYCKVKSPGVLNAV